MKYHWIVGVLIPISLSAQLPPQHLDVLLQTYEHYVDYLWKTALPDSCTTYNVEFSDHTAAPLLRTILLARLKDNPNVVIVNRNAADCRLMVSVIHFHIQYLQHSSSDSIRCVFRWRILPLIETSAGRQYALPSLDTAVTRTYARSVLPFLESPAYPFTQAPIPEPESSFWKQYGEPLLLLTSSVLAVLLFFTMRSQ